MSEQQNIDVVKQGYEAFGRGDIGGLLALLDPDVRWTTPGPSDLPTAGTRRGPQAVGEFFQTVNEIGEIQRFETNEFIAQGDRVVVLGEATERVKSTGGMVEYKFVHLFTVRGGRVISFIEYTDMSALVGELRQAQAAR
jgi:ketosteroid isomerase-like protein